ncbi:MAG TPA: siderophore-interacting protein [Cellulomonas sp.]
MSEHRAQVLERWDAGPRMVGLRVRIDDGFVSTGIGDEYLRLHLPDRTTTNGADGSPPVDAATGYYTIRAWDAVTGLADILFLRHGHGRAAAWAAAARPGARFFASRQRSGYRPPADARRILLLGDATALPAIARILELDPRPELSAVVQVEHAEEQGTATRDPRVRWIVAAHRDRVLAGALAARGVEDGDYTWFAGEAGEMRVVRRWLRHERAVPAEGYLTMGYWRADSERLIARMRALPPEAAHELEQIWASGLPGEEQRDLADDAMVRWGMEER